MGGHLGIAAVSSEGAAICYRQVLRKAGQVFGSGDAPRVTLHNEPLARYLHAINADDWQAVGLLLLRSAEVLSRCGATLCLCPDNALQHGVHLVQDTSPVPWLSMPELVADAVAEDGRRVVGLIGTKLVMRSSTYQTLLGLKGVHLLTPEEADQDRLDSIIFSELIYGRIHDESKRFVYAAMSRLGERGCEAVILGSSEAPLIVTADTAPMPVYDATDLLAHAAVQRLHSAAEGG